MPDARMALYAGGVEIYLAPNADSRDSWQGTPNHPLPFTLHSPPLHSYATNRFSKQLPFGILHARADALC